MTATFINRFCLGETRCFYWPPNLSW